MPVIAVTCQSTTRFSNAPEAIAHAGAILITVPAHAKTELAAYIRRTQPQIVERISDVQILDYSSDGALVALARSFFKADDRMHLQAPR